MPGLALPCPYFRLKRPGSWQPDSLGRADFSEPQGVNRSWWDFWLEGAVGWWSVGTGGRQVALLWELFEALSKGISMGDQRSKGSLVDS